MITRTMLADSVLKTCENTTACIFWDQWKQLEFDFSISALEIIQSLHETLQYTLVAVCTGAVENASVTQQLKHHSNTFRDMYLCRQSGTRVIHGWSSRCRSALCGHVESAAKGLLGKWVSLGLWRRVCACKLGSCTAGCHLKMGGGKKHKTD